MAFAGGCAEGVALDFKGYEPGSVDASGETTPSIETNQSMTGEAGAVASNVGSGGAGGAGGSTDQGRGPGGAGDTHDATMVIGDATAKTGDADAGGTPDEGASSHFDAGAGTDALRACETISLMASADAFILANEPSGNTGTSAQLAVTASGASSTRVLLSFALDQVPADATIDVAELQLTVESSSGPARAIEVHRVDAARLWTEAGVTWTSYAPGTAWTAGGGDFATSASASAIMSGADAVGTIRTWNVLPDVQFLQKERAPFSGWLIKDSGESDAGSGEVVRFFSRETVHPPKLQIEFCQ